MVKPRKTLYSRSLGRSKPAPRYCKNSQCGAKLPENAKKDQVYCDDICRDEHHLALKLARRPKDVHCSFCGKLLDPLSREPYQWKTELHFCDTICTDGYRREHGTYAEMSEKGNAAMQDYKAKHGKVQSADHRAAVVAKNNREAPPKAKHFQRTGKAWGYDVNFFPNENGDGYRASLPELEELGVIHCKTKKEGLLLIRQRIVGLRSAPLQG